MHYLRIYKTLFKINLTRFIIYRGDFINNIISSTVYGILSFITIIFLTSRTPVVFGWTRTEFMLLVAVYNIIIGGIFHMFFSRNFVEIPETINYGRLDAILLKPIDSQFVLSTWLIRYSQIIRIIMGTAVAAYIISVNHIVISLVQYIEFFGLSVFGLLIIYSIWFSVMTITVWSPRLSNLIDLLSHFNDLARFPPKMYDFLREYALLVLPYTLIVVLPVKTLIKNITVFEVVELIMISLVFFWCSRKFWRFALRFYTSASS